MLIHFYLNKFDIFLIIFSTLAHWEFRNSPWPVVRTTFCWVPTTNKMIFYSTLNHEKKIKTQKLNINQSHKKEINKSIKISPTTESKKHGDTREHNQTCVVCITQDRSDNFSHLYKVSCGHHHKIKTNTKASVSSFLSPPYSIRISEVHFSSHCQNLSPKSQNCGKFFQTFWKKHTKRNQRTYGLCLSLLSWRSSQISKDIPQKKKKSNKP